MGGCAAETGERWAVGPRLEAGPWLSDARSATRGGDLGQRLGVRASVSHLFGAEGAGASGVLGPGRHVVPAHQGGEVGGQARTLAQDSCSHVPGFAVGARVPTGQTLVPGQSRAASSEPLGTPRPPPANLSPRWTSRLVTVTGADCSFPGGGVVCRAPEHGRASSACCLFLMPSQFSPVASSLKLGK